MSPIQLADGEQIETGKHQREKPCKEQWVMHDFMRVWNKGRVGDELFKEQEEQILSQNNIDHTILHQLRPINVSCIVGAILGVFRVKLKNKLRRRQVGKTVPQDRHSQNKSGQWTGDADVEMLLFGNRSF